MIRKKEKIRQKEEVAGHHIREVEHNPSRSRDRHLRLLGRIRSKPRKVNHRLKSQKAHKFLKIGILMRKESEK